MRPTTSTPTTCMTAEEEEAGAGPLLSTSAPVVFLLLPLLILVLILVLALNLLLQLLPLRSVAAAFTLATGDLELASSSPVASLSASAVVDGIAVAGAAGSLTRGRL